MKIARTATILILFSLVVVLVYILFQNDIVVISNQLATDSGIIKQSVVAPFAFRGGYVEYVDEQTSDEVLSFPVLSTVKARVKIPDVGIDGYILEGKDENLLDKGFWHFPSASPYSSKGNVVIIGHRFLKLPPHRDTFYNLNRVKTGDKIEIITTDRVFKYVVREQKIIKTTDTYVLQPTINAQLTLITCHPLWTSAERLVVIADRVEE